MLVAVSGLPVKRTAEETNRELSRILGDPLVAVLMECAPQERTERSRAALEIAEVLLVREQSDVVRAWFAGMNPDLDDANPLLVLTEGDAAERQRVLDAARRYIAEL